jgi:hypothetical protein
MILGMPPLHDSYEADAQIFAERLIVRLAEEGLTDAPLIERLRALTFSPTREAYWAASDALKTAYEQRSRSSALHLGDAMVRCEYYAAQKGAVGSAYVVAGRALAYACYSYFPGVVRREFGQAALGWLLCAALELPDIGKRFGPPREGTTASRAAKLGREAYDELARLASAAPSVKGPNPNTDEWADA